MMTMIMMIMITICMDKTVFLVVVVFLLLLSPPDIPPSDALSRCGHR